MINAIELLRVPEQRLVTRRRRQIMDDEALDLRELDKAEHKDLWVRDFIARFAEVMRSKR
jgi:hypothetical protein